MKHIALIVSNQDRNRYPSGQTEQAIMGQLAGRRNLAAASMASALFFSLLHVVAYGPGVYAQWIRALPEAEEYNYVHNAPGQS